MPPPRKLKKWLCLFAVLALLITFLPFVFHMGVRPLLLWGTANCDYEWDVSPVGVVTFFDPQWACFNSCPGFVVVDADKAELQDYIGKDMRVSQSGQDVYWGNKLPQKTHFFRCKGQFKKSIAFWWWEYDMLRLEGLDKSEPVTGRSFAMQWCEEVVPTKVHSERADAYLRKR